MYFHTTDKRCKNLQISIEKYKGNAPFDLSTIKFTSGGVSNNKKLMGTPLKNLYNKYIQKLDNLKEILKNVFRPMVFFVQWRYAKMDICN